MCSSLTRGAEDIKFIEFEQKSYSHVVVTASSTTLQVWDLLSLSISWCVKMDVTALSADPLSEHFAAFTADGQLFVFKAEQRVPLFKMAARNGGNRKVMAALFVPRDQEAELEGELPAWMQKSKLYYVTESQLLSIPIHAVPHISLLCEDFLACQLSAKYEFPDSMRIEEMAKDVEEREEEQEEKITKEKKKAKKKKEKLDKNVEIIDDLALESLFSVDTQPCLDL
ncbi:hypothetical protein LSTR_LSTR007133, partial [Laodelphax striatellus]